MDTIFKALADPTRRQLLDRLYWRDGQSLGALCNELDMTRFGVMKHLRVLEDAGLIASRRAGRHKLHFLNAVPIGAIYDPWVRKYAQRPTAVAVNE
jgi:DNA-binding transcriptional ArsR family regulator